MGIVDAGALNTNTARLQALQGQRGDIEGNIAAGQNDHGSAFTALQGETADFDGRIADNTDAFVGSESFLGESTEIQAGCEETVVITTEDELVATDELEVAGEGVVVAGENEDIADTELGEAETLEGIAEVDVDVADVALTDAGQRVGTAENREGSLLQQIQAEENKSVLQKIGSFFSKLFGLKQDYSTAQKDTIAAVVGEKDAAAHMAAMGDAHKNAQGVTDTAKEVLETRKDEHANAVDLADAAQVILDAATGEREVSEEELAAAIQVVADAQAERDRLEAEGIAIDGAKTAMQAEYDTLLAQLSAIIVDGEIQLDALDAEIAALQETIAQLEAEAEKEAQELAMLEMLNGQLMAGQAEFQGDWAGAGAFGRGGLADSEAALLEAQTYLEVAMLTGCKEMLEAAYALLAPQEIDKMTGDPIAPPSYAEAMEAVAASANFARDLEVGTTVMVGDQEIVVNMDMVKDLLAAEMEALGIDAAGAMVEQGWAGKLAGGINNGLGLGQNGNGLEEKMAQMGNLMQQLQDATCPNEIASLYRAITGQALDEKAIVGMALGEPQLANSFASEAISDYKATQEAGANIVKGVTTAVVIVAGVALAIPTGGASLGATALIAAGVGAGAAIVVNGSDTIFRPTLALDENGRLPLDEDGKPVTRGEWNAGDIAGNAWNYVASGQILKDGLSGAVDGLLTVATGGLAKGATNMMVTAGSSTFKKACAYVGGQALGGFTSGFVGSMKNDLLDMSPLGDGEWSGSAGDFFGNAFRNGLFGAGASSVVATGQIGFHQVAGSSGNFFGDIGRVDGMSRAAGFTDGFNSEIKGLGDNRRSADQSRTADRLEQRINILDDRQRTFNSIQRQRIITDLKRELANVPDTHIPSLLKKMGIEMGKEEISSLMSEVMNTAYESGNNNDSPANNGGSLPTFSDMGYDIDALKDQYGGNARFDAIVNSPMLTDIGVLNKLLQEGFIQLS
jgi:hypothetical protein